MIRMGNPALRLIALAKFHKRMLLLTASAAAVISFILGVMAPPIFRAEAVLKVEPQSKSGPFANFTDPFSENQTALKDAEVLIYSQDVLNDVATELMASRVNPDLAFPNSIRLTDFSFRFKMVAKRLRSRLNLPVESQEKNVITPEHDQKVVAGLIRNQMRVVPDVEGRMLRLIVEAADRYLAQRICELVAEKFLKASLLKVQDELLRQEKYLVSTIDLQQDKITDLEKKLQQVKKNFSRLEMRGNVEQAGQGDAVGQIVERKGSLAEVEAELMTNERLYDEYSRELASADMFDDIKRLGLREKIEKDLAEIEYRRLEFVAVKGYPEGHPVLQNLKNESEKLNQLLTKVMGDNTSKEGSRRALAGTSKELSAKLVTVTDRIKWLNVKKDLLKSQVNKKEKQMSTALDLETQGGALSRDLSGHFEILRELRRHLEETRMKIVGAVNTANLLVPPSFPLIPVSLSVIRRTVFGFCAGGVFALMIFFLFDFARPRLLVKEDLSAMKVHTFGHIRFDHEAISHFVSCLLTLVPTKSETRKERQGQVVLFSMINLSLNLEYWLVEVAQMMVDAGFQIGVILVQDDDPQLRRETTMIEKIEVTRLHPDEISYSFPQLLGHMRRHNDWVMVLGKGLEPGPATLFLTRHADHLFYITRYGRSELGAIERIRSESNFTPGVNEHALVMNHIM